jgi:ABC-type polysaccharide/polyol phosphate transport system ATPase subunit
MSQPAVEVNNLSKRFRLFHERNQTLKSAVMRGKRGSYEDFWALKDVSFDVAEGQTFGLIGRNGSGKSTLLKCLAQILYPTSGEIRYNGRMASLLEVGSGFHPELSGIDNIFLNGAILGMSKKEIKSKLDSIINFAGVGSFIDQPVKNYSSGMYVRLGFSVAIHVEPEILILDEVLAVGDKDFKKKCDAKFSEIKKSGRTIVLVTHDMKAVQDMCDSAAWLDKGVVKDLGPAAGVVKSYLASR